MATIIDDTRQRPKRQVRIKRREPKPAKQAKPFNYVPFASVRAIELRGIAKAIILLPWAACIVLGAAMALVHYDVIYKDVNELTGFCAGVTRTSEKIMCSDIATCDPNAVYLSWAAYETNSFIADTCPESHVGMFTRVPYEIVAPDAEASAEMMAQIGAMNRAQRNQVIREAFQAQGGPE